MLFGHARRHALNSHAAHNVQSLLKLIVVPGCETLRGPRNHHIGLDAGTFETLTLPSYIFGFRHYKHVAQAGVALILDIDLKPREQPSVADEVSIR